METMRGLLYLTTNKKGNSGGGTLSELFPTRMSFVLFVSYMALFINQGILVTASKDANNKYNYNPTTVVLLTELLKLIISTILYLQTNSFQDMIVEISRNRTIFLKYFIPSFLYCLYNNLAFVNLSAYDPTTYFLLLQFRVVVTGVIFQILFAKKLCRVQWLSLLLLTTGCIIKQVDYTKLSEDTSGGDITHFVNIHFVYILVQVFASCFAGVYNEYLLKEKDNTVHIMLQNVFMYVDSIACNVFVLMVRQAFVASDSTTTTAVSSGNSLADAFSYSALSLVLFNYKVLLIMFNNAAIGLVTSLFLKSLNSILKTFASALELMFTAVLAWIIFGIALNFNTVLAIGIVSLATWLYSKKPVQNSIIAAAAATAADAAAKLPHFHSSDGDLTSKSYHYHENGNGLSHLTESVLMLKDEEKR